MKMEKQARIRSIRTMIRTFFFYSKWNKNKKQKQVGTEPNLGLLEGSLPLPYGGLMWVTGVDTDKPGSTPFLQQPRCQTNGALNQQGQVARPRGAPQPKDRLQEG